MASAIAHMDDVKVHIEVETACIEDASTNIEPVTAHVEPSIAHIEPVKAHTVTAIAYLDAETSYTEAKHCSIALGPNPGKTIVLKWLLHRNYHNSRTFCTIANRCSVTSVFQG